MRVPLLRVLSPSALSTRTTRVPVRGLLHRDMLARPFASVGDYRSRTHKDQHDLVRGEPAGPKIHTDTIPGPKGKAGLKHLDALQDTRAATMMTGKCFWFDKKKLG